MAAAHGRRGWRHPAINLVGCIFFGISAIAAYLVPSTGSVINLAAANWNTALGAACFLTCAVATQRWSSVAAPRASHRGLGQTAHLSARKALTEGSRILPARRGVPFPESSLLPVPYQMRPAPGG